MLGHNDDTKKLKENGWRETVHAAPPHPLLAYGRVELSLHIYIHQFILFPLSSSCSGFSLSLSLFFCLFFISSLSLITVNMG